MTHPSGHLDPYKAAAELHGPCFEAMLWQSRETQSVRFEVILSMVDVRGRTVIDMGSGLADFAAFLERKRAGAERIVCVEGVACLDAQARQRNLPRTEHVCGDFVADPALIDELGRTRPGAVWIFSGSLNTLGQSDAVRVLERAWAAGAHTLVFNFITTWSGLTADQAKPATLFEPFVMLDAAAKLTNHLAMRSGYLPNRDMTIVLGRGETK